MILWILIAFIGLYVWYQFTSLRIMSKHPLLTAFYSVKDVWDYITKKGYNTCPTGEMICFSAHFGKGKTLSAVHRVASLYHRYNNKIVYDKYRKKYVKQVIHVISNVKFNDIETYEPLDGLQQIVNNAYLNRAIDEAENTRTVLLVLIDEASVQLNSRNFKSNITADFLNTLLTSRHYNMSMFYTSQKFNLTDKLLRDVTQLVIECKKIWRLQVQYIYDGTELEQAGNSKMVAPMKKTGWFIRNRDYNRYDTLAVVENLKHSVDKDDFLSAEEILALRQNGNTVFMDDQKPKTKFIA